jgi:hypothetical protein
MLNLTPRLIRYFAAGFAIFLVLAATAVFAAPGPTACLAVGVLPLHRLVDDSLVDRLSASDEQRYAALMADARSRITVAFGAPEAKPIVVFFNRSEGIGLFKLNSYASAQFVAHRACLFIGPNGQSVDVVAHELMHSELHHRVGAWQRMVNVPTWFDEGVAMQVDHRSRYDLSQPAAQVADSVRSLTTMSAFSSGDEATLVYRYAAAKASVATLLTKVGPSTLYSRLSLIRDGVSLEIAFAP